MIWTGPNDAPLSTKEERMAAMTLDFRDVVRELDWYEKWPVEEGLATKLDFGQHIFDGAAVVIGRTVDFTQRLVFFRFHGKATLREVVAREHLYGDITESSPSRARHFNQEVIENAVSVRIDPL